MMLSKFSPEFSAFVVAGVTADASASVTVRSALT